MAGFVWMIYGSKPATGEAGAWYFRAPSAEVAESFAILNQIEIATIEKAPPGTIAIGDLPGSVERHRPGED